MFRTIAGEGGRAGPARPRRALKGVGVAALWIALATVGCTRGGAGATWLPRYVLAPEEVHYGGSYAEWSARWWQWAFEHPRTDHPLYDETGGLVAEGQIAPVWFLGGIYRPWGEPTNGTVIRNVSIPSGVALFFPVINVFASADACEGPNVDVSFTELRDFARDAVENVRDLRCELDGVVVFDSPDLSGAVRWRAQAPEFNALIPEDNIFADQCGGVPITPRVMGPIASDGIWMMVEPLPRGFHTVHFRGTFPTGGPFRVDVTYNITVLP